MIKAVDFVFDMAVGNVAKSPGATIRPNPEACARNMVVEPVANILAVHEAVKVMDCVDPMAEGTAVLCQVATKRIDALVCVCCMVPLGSVDPRAATKQDGMRVIAQLILSKSKQSWKLKMRTGRV